MLHRVTGLEVGSLEKGGTATALLSASRLEASTLASASASVLASGLLDHSTLTKLFYLGFGSMEDEWMKQIPSSSICNFFYFFFVVYAVIFTLSIISVIGTATSMKTTTPMLLPLLANAVLTSLIGGTMMLFYYLICDRALLAPKTPKPAY